jgi:glucose/arabinose dehydrogenase
MTTGRHFLPWIFLIGTTTPIFLASASEAATTYPSGFSQTVVASGLSQPVAQEFAPDGRLFVGERTGGIRIVKNGSLLPTPFAALPADTSGERGMLGITVDPQFATNHFVYAHYDIKISGNPIRARVTRLTASSSNPDVMVAGSEVVLLDNIPSPTGVHEGGDMHFGSDDKLYIAVGDGGVGTTTSQNLGSLEGKILRINRDGTVPADNPFVGTAGARPEIWAYGFRNPFTFAIDPNSSRILVNDVGQDSVEEIDDLKKGANYGWPTCEGACAGHPEFTNPIYQYNHSFGRSITGGAFYTGSVYPQSYNGDYFFGDYTTGFIKSIDLNNGNTVSSFGDGVITPVNLKQGPDGLIYYTSISAGTVNKINYTTGAPPPPTGQGNGLYASYFPNISLSGNPVLNRVEGTLNNNWGSGSPDPAVPVDNFSARWTGEVLARFTETYTFSVKSDDGIRLWVNNQLLVDKWVDQSSVETSGTIALQAGQRYAIKVEYYEHRVSAVAQLSWASPSTPKQIVPQSQLFASLPGQAPVAVIESPAATLTYNAGDTITYSGDATDLEDGVLPPSAFSWSGVLHHDTHTHPFFGPVNGTKSGSVVIPRQGEPSANTWYEFVLTVTDSSGQVTKVSREIHPNTVNLTLAANVPGLTLNLDGQPKTTPYTVAGVTGFERVIGAVDPQTVGGKTYRFVGWSDGGAATHTITTPGTNTTYTATFAEVTPPPPSGSTVVIYAAGTPVAGVYPSFDLLVDNVKVASFSNVRGDAKARVFQQFTYSSPTALTIRQLRVRFTNDAYAPPEDRNLRVDRITLDGVDYQSEASTVLSTGTWSQATGCAAGNKSSEWLDCNGYFQYAP